jgi:hypothetical protein
MDKVRKPSNSECNTVAERLIGMLSVDVILLMTEEAHFYLSGCVNEQSFRYWAEENPHQLYHLPPHSARVAFWCGVTNFGVMGPYFFADEDWRAVTVTSARYVEMLRTSSHQNRDVVELSSRPYGFSKMVQLPKHRDHSWRSFGKCSGARQFTARRASMACTFS